MSTGAAIDSIRPSAAPLRATPLLTLVRLSGQMQGKTDARTVVRSMLRHAVGPYGTRAVSGGDAALAWAVLVPDDATPLTSWSLQTAEGGEVCLFEGELYDDPPVAQSDDGESTAAYLAACLRERPWQRPEGLNGVYSCVYAERGGRSVYVFGDETGTRPIYWHSADGVLVVTNNLWSFRGCPVVRLACDRMALLEALTIGFPLRGRTWIDGVRQLKPGMQLCSSIDGSTVVRSTAVPAERASWSFDRTVETLRGTMDDTFSRLGRRLGGSSTLALSGGLDSRLCLAALAAEGVPGSCLTFGAQTDDIDMKLAAAASALTGRRHDALILNSSRAFALYRDLRIMNEGESPGFGYFFLAEAAQQKSGALIIGAEAVRDTPLGAFRPSAVADVASLAAKVLEGQCDRFSPVEALRILSPGFRTAWRDVLDEWNDSFLRIRQQSIVDVYLDHIMTYRVQRRTRPRLDAARWFCLPVYPFMDRELYRAFRTIPLEHLRDERAHLALLSGYGSGLDRLPNAARAAAGIPIAKEYDYRRLVHLARFLRQRVAAPLASSWQRVKGRCGRGQSALVRLLPEGDAERLRTCALFDRNGIDELFAQARSGVFTNRTALHSLGSALTVFDFLFGSPADQPALRFLETEREIGEWSAEPLAFSGRGM